MRNIISEDIIRKALDESIDEFILEEGWAGNAWNALKGSQLGQMAGKAWNGFKNYAAMYMDAKTNGRWNQQYGEYVNGNTKSGELFYLDKWFNYYREKLNSIIYQANNPDRRDDYDLWERDPETKKETMKRKRYDYVGVEGALEYAKTYCNFQNFNDYIRAISPKRESVTLINTYIQNYITKQVENRNLKAVLHNLNIMVFYSSDEGKAYMEMNRGQQQKDERRSRIQNAWDERKAKREAEANNTTNNASTPTPNNQDGTFNFPESGLKYYGKDKKYFGWAYSTDGNGKRIIVNPSNPKQAVFI